MTLQCTSHIHYCSRCSINHHHHLMMMMMTTMMMCLSF